MPKGGKPYTSSNTKSSGGGKSSKGGSKGTKKK